MTDSAPGPLRRLRALFGTPTPAAPRGRVPVLPPRRTTACQHADEQYRAVIEAARALPDGTPADDALIAALTAEIDARRHGNGLEDGPALPALSGLCVRREGLPDWWEGSESLMLVSPESQVPEVTLGLFGWPAHRAIVAIGAGTTPPTINFTGSDALIAVGDRVTMLASSYSIGEGATILVGEDTTATWMTFGDVRNAGMLIVGADCMIASGINFLSDDTHAIRDAETGRRVNLRGGRIVIEEHVWVADHARIMGDSRIGSGGVVGATSFVKGVHLPPNSISIGRPARAVRSGIVWTRDDAP